MLLQALLMEFHTIIKSRGRANALFAPEPQPHNTDPKREACFSDSGHSKAEVLSLFPLEVVCLSPWSSVYQNPSNFRGFGLRHMVWITLLQLRACLCLGIPLKVCAEGRKRRKQEMTALYRTPAGPRAVILTTTDGTDPNGYSIG